MLITTVLMCIFHFCFNSVSVVVKIENRFDTILLLQNKKPLKQEFHKTLQALGKTIISFADQIRPMVAMYGL